MHDASDSRTHRPEKRWQRAMCRHCCAALHGTKRNINTQPASKVYGTDSGNMLAIVCIGRMDRR